MLERSDAGMLSKLGESLAVNTVNLKQGDDMKDRRRIEMLRALARIVAGTVEIDRRAAAGGRWVSGWWMRGLREDTARLGELLAREAAVEAADGGTGAG